jgi:hypothetical protein
MATFTTLYGLDSFAEPSLDQRLKNNIPMFFDWGFIDKGAFINVRRNNSGQYGDSKSRLSYVSDPKFTNGKVWESTRKNWIWESGISQTTQPISISGVYVNNTFYPSNTSGAYSHYIDYPNGRVIFNNPIATSSNVQVEYSYKFIQFFDAAKFDWIKQIQFYSLRGDKTQNRNRASGEWSPSPEQRIQLPAVAMEISNSTTYEPYAIGTGAKYAYKDIIFHILAEDDNTASKIADIISSQEEKTIFMYDDFLLAKSGVQQLNSNGSVNNGAKTYPQLVEPVEDGGFRWRKTRFSNAISQISQDYGNIWLRQVRLTTETVLT